MLADQLDYVIGVDPHRDVHAIAVVEVRTGGVVYEGAIAASTSGYRRALDLAAEHAPGRRAFAVEGSGSFGAGLTRFLSGDAEMVFEVGRLRRERRSGGKTDPALDAIRAARVVLAQERPAKPRAGGQREAFRALMAARDGAVNARRAGLCQLRDLIITAPEPLRSELRPLTRSRLLRRLAGRRHVTPTLSCAAHSRPCALSPAGSNNSPTRSVTSKPRSQSWPASSHRSCSTSPASAHSPRRRSCCSPGLTPAASAVRLPSHVSPAARQFRPVPVRRSATASTEAATANSTARCT